MEFYLYLHAIFWLQVCTKTKILMKDKSQEAIALIGVTYSKEDSQNRKFFIWARHVLFYLCKRLLIILLVPLLWFVVLQRIA